AQEFARHLRHLPVRPVRGDGQAEYRAVRTGAEDAVALCARGSVAGSGAAKARRRAGNRRAGRPAPHAPRSADRSLAATARSHRTQPAKLKPDQCRMSARSMSDERLRVAVRKRRSFVSWAFLIAILELASPVSAASTNFPWASW